MFGTQPQGLSEILRPLRLESRLRPPSYRPVRARFACKFISRENIDLWKPLPKALLPHPMLNIPVRHARECTWPLQGETPCTEWHSGTKVTEKGHQGMLHNHQSGARYWHGAGFTSTAAGIAVT